MEKGVTITIYNAKEHSPLDVSMRIEGDPHLNHDGIIDYKRIVDIMERNIPVVGFTNEILNTWRRHEVNTVYTMIYHLLKVSYVSGNVATNHHVFDLMDNAKLNQLIINYATILDYDGSNLPHIVLTTNVDLSDAAITAILNNVHTCRNFFTHLPYGWNKSATYVTNLKRAALKAIEQADYTTIKGFKRLSAVASLMSAHYYDTTTHKEEFVLNRTELQEVFTRLNMDTIVNLLHKNRTSKNTRYLLNIVEPLFRDRFTWGSLDDDFMKRYYPEGLSIGDYTYVDPDLADYEESELIGLIPGCFDTDPAKAMMVLLLETNPKRIQSIYRQIAKAMMENVNNMSPTYRPGVDQHEYFKKAYEQVKLADKDNVLETHLRHSIECLVTLVEAKNSASCYHKFNSWRIRHNIDSFVKHITYSKEIKRLGMTAKLKK